MYFRDVPNGYQYLVGWLNRHPMLNSIFSMRPGGFLFCLAALLVWSTGALGQSDSLVLASADTVPGTAVSLNLSLTSPSGSEPAGLQWALSFSSVAIARISV